ncbi:MAG: ABC transporter permease subunit [Pseudomonadota bacterium]
MQLAGDGEATHKATTWSREWRLPDGVGTFLLLLPGLVFFVVLFVLPATTAVTRSFTDRETDSFSWVNFQTFLGDANGWGILGYTLGLATAATLVAALISLPLAEILRHRPPGNRFFRLLIISPLLLPGIVNAFGLYLLFERWGWFNKFLVDVVPFISTPWEITNTTPGLIFFYAIVLFPFTAINALAAMEAIDPSLEEAAAVSGAGPWLRFRHVILPGAARGIIAGSIMTFVMCFGALSIPLILGGELARNILSFEVYRNAVVFGKWELASAIAVIMGLVQLIAIGAYLALAQGSFARGAVEREAG